MSKRTLERAAVVVGLGTAACLAASFLVEFTPYSTSAGSYARVYLLSASLFLMLALGGLIFSLIERGDVKDER